jgi:pimeloyl-ACP methyl ester carboxylesterase
MSKLSRRKFIESSALLAGTSCLSAPIVASAVGVSEASGAPEVQPAPGMPAPRIVGSNSINMAVYEQGSGLPVVFCHGFPELAYSWRNQIAVFADSGIRAIVPDQRGYGLTDRPAPISDYATDILVDDIAGLLDTLEIDKAVICGHDWGGGIAWMMPRYHPDRVLGVIGVNTPAFHPDHGRTPNELIVPSERYYTRTFQPPGEAEAVLERDVKSSFEFFLRRGGMWNRDRFMSLPEDSAARRLDLLTMIQEGDPEGELILTEAELDYFVQTFQATGFTGGLNWYRAAATPSSRPIGNWDIDVPCLYVGAANDVVLPPSSADGMENYISDLTKHTIADCGHWTQQEQPDQFNRIALEWLNQKFLS